MARQGESAPMSRLPLALLAILAVLLLVAPAALAQDSPSAAQQPPEPNGEPQPDGPTEPTEPTEPIEPGQPGTTARLPRTGLDGFRIAGIGILLLLVGARLRVVARVKQVIRRRLSARARLREELEQLRLAAELSPPEAEPTVARVEPTTPTARRMAGRAGR
jgi:hypothetical protein